MSDPLIDNNEGGWLYESLRLSGLELPYLSGYDDPVVIDNYFFFMFSLGLFLF